MKLAVIILSVLGLLMTSSAHAAAKNPHQNINTSHKKVPKSAKIKSSAQAAQLVKSRIGGKVLKVKNSYVAGKKAYQVKILKNNGHIVSYYVDAQTGRFKGK